MIEYCESLRSVEIAERRCFRFVRSIKLSTVDTDKLPPNSAA